MAFRAHHDRRGILLASDQLRAIRGAQYGETAAGVEGLSRCTNPTPCFILHDQMQRAHLAPKVDGVEPRITRDLPEEDLHALDLDERVSEVTDCKRVAARLQSSQMKRTRRIDRSLCPIASLEGSEASQGL